MKKESIRALGQNKALADADGQFKRYMRVVELQKHQSKAFRAFCEKAFGKDFSQDGFSDLSQVDRVLKFIPPNGYVFDIGCGNGKMLGYIQEKTDAYIYGFDYSGNAIDLAKELFKNISSFTQGCIGDVEYPDESFDTVISMDTMYFAYVCSS